MKDKKPLHRKTLKEDTIKKPSAYQNVNPESDTPQKVKEGNESPAEMARLLKANPKAKTGKKAE